MDPCGGEDNVKSNDTNLQASDSKPDGAATDDDVPKDSLEQPTEASATVHGGARRGRFSGLLPNMMKSTNAARKKTSKVCSVATIAKFK